MFYNKGMNSYPRPQFKRNSFYSLNGIWKLNDKDINVPYPKESDLSNYPNKEYEENLIYVKEFVLPNNFYNESQKVILHFEAVDNICEVYLNDNYIGKHVGGYLPFSFNITDYLIETNILKVIVKDNNDTFYPYGKQTLKPSGMWYTGISGIWKSVWVEAAPKENEIKSIKLDTSVDSILFNVDCDCPYSLKIKFDDKEYSYTSNEKIFKLDLKEIKYQVWDVNNPIIYPFVIETISDQIESYVAIREFNIQEINGIKRFCLNNKPIYLNAILDQGYFIDGIYLPNDDKEYLDDIKRMKELGFNCLRKHIKVEDEMFYYYCDTCGMLVMQDMVNSGEVNFFKNILLPTLGFVKQKDDIKVNKKRLDFFINHSKETIEYLYNHPCIISYTIYNESWGQQCANIVYKQLKQIDTTRPFDTCSGWYKDYDSDIDSYHVYFRNKVLKIRNKDKVLMLSEFGGIKRHVKGHEFNLRKANYGYGFAKDEDDLTNKIERMYRKMLFPSILNGLCGSVFTQLCDVEEEENGLYTYDRKVCKVNKKRIIELNNTLYKLFKESL